MPAVAAPGVGKYLYVTEDGSFIVQSTEPTEVDYAMIEEGTLTVIRAIPQASGLLLWEQLVTESTTEDGDDDEDVIEAEAEVKWETSWEGL